MDRKTHPAQLHHLTVTLQQFVLLFRAEAKQNKLKTTQQTEREQSDTRRTLAGFCGTAPTNLSVSAEGQLIAISQNSHNSLTVKS